MVKDISTVIAHVGGVSRFSGPKQLAALCEYLVEAGVFMQRTKFDFPLKMKFRELRKRMGGKKAAVALFHREEPDAVHRGGCRGEGES